MSWYEARTVQEKRELYKAFRSAHDGICPVCGGRARETRVPRALGYEVVSIRTGGYDCVAGCGFHLTVAEVGEIRSWHGEFHRDLAAVIDRWRGARQGG